MHKHRKGAVFCRSGFRADPLCDFFLDHNGDPLKALQLQKCAEGGCRDVIGKIRAGREAGIR